MAKDKTTRKYFFLLIATIVVFSIGFLVTDKSNADIYEAEAPVQEVIAEVPAVDICQQSVTNIKTIINSPSQCSSDADCVFMPIACSIGCPSVNQSDAEKIRSELAKRGNCMCTMEACMEAAAACVEGICKTVPLTQ